MFYVALIFQILCICAEQRSASRLRTHKPLDFNYSDDLYSMIAKDKLVGEIWKESYNTKPQHQNYSSKHKACLPYGAKLHKRFPAKKKHQLDVKFENFLKHDHISALKELNKSSIRTSDTQESDAIVDSSSTKSRNISLKIKRNFST